MKRGSTAKETPAAIPVAIHEHISGDVLVAAGYAAIGNEDYNRAVAFFIQAKEKGLSQKVFDEVSVAIKALQQPLQTTEDQKAFTRRLVKAAVGVAIKVTGKEAEISGTVLTYVNAAVKKHWESIQPIQGELLDPKSGLVGDIATMLKQHTTGILRKREGAVVFRETANVGDIEQHITIAQHNVVAAASVPAPTFAVVCAPPAVGGYYPPYDVPSAIAAAPRGYGASFDIGDGSYPYAAYAATPAVVCAPPPAHSVGSYYPSYGVPSVPAAAPRGYGVSLYDTGNGSYPAYGHGSAPRDYGVSSYDTGQTYGYGYTPSVAFSAFPAPVAPTASAPPPSYRTAVGQNPNTAVHGGDIVHRPPTAGIGAGHRV